MIETPLQHKRVVLFETHPFGPYRDASVLYERSVVEIGKLYIQTVYLKGFVTDQIRHRFLIL